MACEQHHCSALDVELCRWRLEQVVCSALPLPWWTRQAGAPRRGITRGGSIGCGVADDGRGRARWRARLRISLAVQGEVNVKRVSAGVRRGVSAQKRTMLHQCVVTSREVRW